MKHFLRYILPTLFIVTAVIILIYVFTPQVKAAQYTKQLDLGMKYLAESNYSEAILAFEKAIQIDVKKMDAYLWKSESYQKNGKPNDAIAVMKDALENVGWTQPELSKLATYVSPLADSSLTDGNTEYAIDWYNVLISMDETSIPIQLGLARAYDANGQNAKALKMLAGLNDDGILPNEGLLLYAKLLMQNRQGMDALTLLEENKDFAATPEAIALADELRIKPIVPSVQPGSHEYPVFTGFSQQIGVTLFVTLDGSNPINGIGKIDAPLLLPEGKTTIKILPVHENGVIAAVQSFEYDVSAPVFDASYYIPVLNQWLKYNMYSTKWSMDERRVIEQISYSGGKIDGENRFALKNGDLLWKSTTGDNTKYESEGTSITASRCEIGKVWSSTYSNRISVNGGAVQQSGSYNASGTFIGTELASFQNNKVIAYHISRTISPDASNTLDTGWSETVDEWIVKGLGVVKRISTNETLLMEGVVW